MKWTEELIKENILDSMKQLNISRMPTGDELKTIGRNDLHCKISRTKKYSGWAEELGIDLKSGSTTREGTRHEKIVCNWLSRKGLEVKTTSHKHPYDIQVNDCVKIDVKVSSPYKSRFGTKYIFAGMKGMPTCDIYILVTLDDSENVKNFFVIPSHLVQQHSLNFKEEYYVKYANDWQTIERYSEFFKNVK